MKTLTQEELELIFLNYLHASGYKAPTIKLRKLGFKYFFKYYGNKDIREMRERDFLNYAEYLREKESRLSGYTRQVLITSVRVLCKCLHVCGILLKNPVEEVKMKKEMGGIREVFSREEIDRFLDVIEPRSMKGVRDRALFELFYSSGMRISEAVKLEYDNVDLESRMLAIRNSKFGKDRIVPLSEVSSYFLRKYIEEKEESTRSGRVFGMSESGIRRSFKKYIHDAGITHKGLQVHSIRHSTATHLLDAGADLRYVQELLGHESIETTVVYTHAPEASLKRVYKQYHPRENEYYEDTGGEYLKRVKKLQKEIEAMKKNRKKQEKNGCGV